MAFNMFYNPFAPVYSSNTTISSQSKINSCVNENFSIQPSRFIPPISYPVFPANNRGFVDQTPNLFDYDITESLCPDFNNLYLYERVWSPLNLKTVTTKETTKSSKTTHDSSTTCSIISPIAQSTPRAIRKTKNFSSNSSNESSSNSYNGKKGVELKDSSKGTLRQKKTECQNQEHFTQGYKKNQKKPWVDKKSFDSSFDSNEGVSPKQSVNNKQRKLPLRSKGIDLSNFINKTSDAASESSYGNSSDSSYNSKSFFDKQQGKVNIQNKCLFCENNGESEEIYMSHPLKDSLGKVVCPILRNFTCPKCGESGDYAHTNKYCPETQRKQKENKIRKYLTKKDF